MRRRKQSIEPVKFVPVEKAFKAAVEIVMLVDVNGYVNNDPSKRLRYHLPYGTTQTIDEDTALDFVAKGYAAYKHKRDYKRSGLTKDEIEERRQSVTNLSLGGANG